MVIDDSLIQKFFLFLGAQNMSFISKNLDFYNTVHSLYQCVKSESKPTYVQNYIKKEIYHGDPKVLI